MKKYALWMSVLLWAGTIFALSSQSYREQDMRPLLAHIFEDSRMNSLFTSVRFQYAGAEVSIQRLGEAGFIEFFIRKGAHFFVFAVLGMLLYEAMCRTDFSNGNAALLSLSIVMCYAVLDEMHQLFTEERSPLWQDSLLDLAGGLSGIGIRMLLKSAVKKEIVQR